MKKVIVLTIAISCLSVWFKPLMAQADSTATRNASSKKTGVTAMPMLSFDRSRGVGFGAMGMILVPLDKHGTTPPSQISVAGQYTTEHDWFASVFSKMYLADDMFRLVLGGGYMNSNFQTYELETGGLVEVPYNNHGTFIFAAPSLRVYPHLYVGIGMQYFKSYLTFNNSSNTEASFQNSLGVNVAYDSKSNQFNPDKGYFGMVLYKGFPSWLSNDTTFNKLSLQVNAYHRLNNTMVLASRFATNLALGDNVPFIAQSYIGNKDIRGYTKGEYRGNQTYALQSELRWSFYKRLGMVGFFGLAMANSPSNLSPLLAGGGVGLRYKALQKFNLNLGVDAAVGKDDWGLYFRIGEAF